MQNLIRILIVVFSLLVFQAVHAIQWCTTYECFTARTVVVPPACIFECGTNNNATIVLGQEEINLSCKDQTQQYSFCPRPKEIPKTETQTTTAAQTQNSDAADKLLKDSQKQAEQAAINQYKQFLTELEATVSAPEPEQANIQKNGIREVPWRDLFRNPVQKKTQTATTTAKGKSCPETYKKNLRLGADEDEVTRVQKFLNKSADTQIAVTGDQSSGKETKKFNAKMKLAVEKFQQKYADEILKPVNEPKATGYWGPYTRKKANDIECGR